jgi:hypothetical protein
MRIRRTGLGIDEARPLPAEEQGVTRIRGLRVEMQLDCRIHPGGPLFFDISGAGDPLLASSEFVHWLLRTPIPGLRRGLRS